MSQSSAVILVIEPEMILNVAADTSDRQYVLRLDEYAKLEFLSVIFLSTDDPQQVALKLEEHGFRSAKTIANPTTSTFVRFETGQHQVEQVAAKTPALALTHWAKQNIAGSLNIVLCVSSSASLSLAGTFNSVAHSTLSDSAAAKLYQTHRDNHSLEKLFVAPEAGLAEVFAGLHWFDALPPGAAENSHSDDPRLGAFSIKRNLGRVAVDAWASSVDLVVDRNGWKRTIAMPRIGERRFVADVEHFQPGDRYAFALDGNHEKLFPDPRSRRQPEGVHGFSELMPPSNFAWQDRNWQGRSKDDLIIYELHIGAFTEQGTFESAIDRLPELVRLGITAIELLPVVESAGRWNWGYDGVNLFAPYHRYGEPDDLKRFVDQCHSLGLVVILDVVYNHPGPEGNYLAKFGPYFSKKHRTPWGPAYNFDGRQSGLSREWVMDNAIYWLSEFHFDGLRLDAIHFMFDDGSPAITRELSERVRQFGKEQGKHYLLIGETNLFDRSMIQPLGDGGAGFDAIWCDDLMHSIYSVGSPETRLTGRTYHQHSDVAEALTHGFLYEGPVTKRIVRDDTAAVDSEPIESMVVALQTHDSVGNQPQGRRLHHLAGADFHRAAAALSLLGPAIPMLFMGDESLEPNPFHYFVDFHDPWLRDAIAKSRRHEHPQQNWSESISPLSDEAFSESKLSSPDSIDPAGERRFTLDWYRQLISIRKQWRLEKLLHANRLTVTHDDQRHIFQLVYNLGVAFRSVVVRLETPGEPEAMQVDGRVIADSNQAGDGDTALLKANHAIVVEGQVVFTEQ